MPTIFVSYRRSDSQDVTGRIYDRLVGKFTQRQIFKDVDSIPLGVSFPAHIRQLLTKANIVAVIIGPNWVNAVDENGRRRLDDPNDFVRLEVELALRADMPVIPVLVSNARMPAASELPPSMRNLASRNGVQVRPDPDFHNDMTRLFSGLDHLERLLAAKAGKPGKTAAGEIVEAQLVSASGPSKRRGPGKSGAPSADSEPLARRKRRIWPWVLLAGLLPFSVLTGGYVFWVSSTGIGTTKKAEKEPFKNEKSPDPMFDGARVLTMDNSGRASVNGFLDQQGSITYQFTATRTGTMRFQVFTGKDTALSPRFAVYRRATGSLISKDSTADASLYVGAGDSYYVRVFPSKSEKGDRTGAFFLTLQMESANDGKLFKDKYDEKKYEEKKYDEKK